MSRFQYFGCNGFGDSVYHRDSGVEPNFEGFQLVGDSQFLRFAEQLLHQRRKKEGRLAYLGLCVSGQKMTDLLTRIRNNFNPVSRKVVLMIGTNDLLQDTDGGRMEEEIKILVHELIKTAQTLIILTIPPVPRLAKNASHWRRLRTFNDKIKTLENGNDVFVIDAYPEFVKKRSSKRSSISSLDFSRSSNRSRNSSTSSRDSRGSWAEYEERRPCKEEPRGDSPMNNSFDRSYSSRWRPVGGNCLNGTVGSRLNCSRTDSPSESPKDSYRRKASRENRFDDSRVKKEERYSNGQRPNGIFSNITSGPRSRLSYDNNLNIMVKKETVQEDGKDTTIKEFRIVYEKRVGKRESRDDPESRETTNYESYRSQFTMVSGSSFSDSSTSLKRKRSSSASLYDSPPVKRKSFSYVEDDHDDTFGEEDSFSQIDGVADEINLDCFEEFFSRNTGRKDLIHLNNYGLRTIKRLISEKIRSLREYR